MTTSIIGDGEKIITTVLLNGERIHVRVHAHANAQSVFDAVVQYVGLTEVRYFGLMIIKDSEQQFLALDEKLSKLAKYAPHLWKDDGSCNSSLVFTIFFRVKFYVENICLLQEQQTRHQYYLQLRKDVLENAIRIHDDTSMVLASYALQTELGDYDKSVHHGDYFVPQHYLPAKTIAKLTIPYIKTALPAMHQSHRGLTEGQSEIEFLKEAQKLSEYGVLFHRVYRNEFNKKLPYNLGICVRGLVVYEETGPVRNPVCKHPWVKVKKMSFKRSKFIIEADSPNPSLSKMTLYTANYKRSRYLLKISSSFFNFQMKMVSKIALLPENMTPEPLVAPTPPPASIPSVRIDAAKPPLHVPPLPPSVKPTPAKTTVAAMTPGKTTLTTESKPQTPKPEAKQYTLDLIKRDGSFGFSIVGGIELGGIFVKDVTQGGPAALSNQINAGDRIVQINKDSFESVTRREAINTLRNAPEKSKFIMETFGQNLVMEADASFNTPFSIQAPTLPAPPVTLAFTQQQLPPVVVHQQQQASEKEADLIRAELVKRDNTFGLVFTGGPEIGGLYVTSLLPHGSAEIDARIAVGDRVLEVAQTNVENFTKKKLQERLKQMQGSTTFVMERYKQLPSNGALMYIDREKVLRSSSNFISITLSKKNDSLGFSITGGLPLAGIFVKYINPNGPAANDTRLEIGDRVVAVNDISLETSGRQKALEILRNTTSPVNLIIEKFGNNVIPMATMAVPGDQGLVRSDSIKSLPVHRGNRPNVDARSSLNYSMQHLANTLPPARGRQFCTDTGVAVSPGGSYTNGGNQLSSAVVESKTNNRKSVSPEVFLVELVKQNGSFGLSLTGGPNLGGIYIKALHPNAPADLDARVRRGDRVVEINTRRMDGLTRQEATDWLKASPSNASLIVERLIPAALQTNNHPFETPPPHQSTSQYSSFDGEFLHVQLHRKNNTFGICLAGGQEQRGIFIKKLMTNGSAALDGRIGKGDKVLEINSFSLDAMTRQQATELLNQSPVLVHLLIEKVHLNCEELTMFDHDFYTVELRKSDSGFGFSITGGADLGGIYVKGILPGGTADSSRKIQKGDRIVETNGVSFEGFTKQQACEVLRKFSGVNASMVMEKAAVFDNIVIPESDYFTVELHKKNNGYGLNLTGGPEIDGVYVKQVQRESSADQDGRITKGDRLITINGRNVENSTRQKCTEMLKLTQDIAVLHLERCVVGDDLPPLDTVLAVVKLTKSTSGFGISLTGGPEIGGIFVKALMTGGCAEKDGRIFVGDRLAEMNSQSFDGLTRQQATELLKNSPAVATFVLERYKVGYKQRQLLNRSGSTEFSHQNNNTKIRNNSVENKTSLIPHDNNSNNNNNNINNDQHFSFPLYTGAAPSVPPRHNGSVGRESAFKRYEQVAAQRQQPNNTNENTHNVQGATVSSHLSTFMRQQSTERQHQQQLVVDNKPTYATVQRNKPNEEQPFPTGNTSGQENMPFSLVEGPMRMHVTNNNNNTIIDDSPQRFLQKFSKQVTTPDNSNIAVSSRIPLGPISSAIFGGQRDSRNVHELLDPAEKHFDGVRYILNNNNEILRAPQDPRDFLPPGSDYVPPRSSHQAPNAGDYVPPRASHQTMPAPQQQTVVTIHNGRPNNASADVKATHTTAPAAEIYKPNKKDTLMAATMSPGNPNDIKKSQGNLRYEDTRPPVTNYEEATPVQHRSAPVMSAKRMPPSLHSDNRPVVSPHQPKQQETTIPVPLASKYSTTPPKSKLGEDIVFEVTLFKGQYGLGMNLTGGGLESPITIKKIAPGTAADESGQLKVGDVVLEVNGRKVSHLTSKEVISILRACGNEVQLLVKRVFHNTPQNLNTPSSSASYAPM